ncbi:MAG: hypothetical protein GX641_02590 [Mollicutes bacterium]|nr:hypothetical protein [Mollicutes bacterium]
MKKIIYLFIVLTVFLIGPLSFRGASNCSGTCTYYVPSSCSGSYAKIFWPMGDSLLRKTEKYDAEAYNHYLEINKDYVTTTADSKKRIDGFYFFFTIGKNLDINSHVIYKNEQWSKYDEAVNQTLPYKLDDNSNMNTKSYYIKYDPINIKDFIANKCECPKLYLQNYCLQEKGKSTMIPAPIVLEKNIDNMVAKYSEMVIIPEESKLEESESANDNENSETISLSEVDKQVYPTEYTIIYSFEPGYDLFWRVEIQKKYNPELYSGKFVAVLKKHGQYYETDKVTYYTVIDLRAIDNQDLNDPESFKTKATITDDKLIACIDRALHPEKYNDYYDNLYKTKCELSKRTKDTDTFFSINWDDIQLYNTEGQPIKCSDFDLDNGENLVKMLFTIIKIIAPVLVIVFGSLDFAKAIFQADEEKQKKAGQDFIKRLIAAALIFLIPTILEIILGVAFNWDEAIPSICVK